MADDWRTRVLVTPEAIGALLARIRRVAVLGARPASQSFKPAYYVPQSLQRMGLTIVPVVVHDHPDTEILGEPVYHRLADVPGPIDLVDVFRRPQDLPGHVEDILTAAPSAVWFQSGIQHDDVAEQLARAGISVVQNRCLMVDYGAVAGR